MSAYNAERYIAEAIESILQQTYQDFEFIIIDDGSSDQTRSILDLYAKKDNRIRLIINQKNLGLIASLNKGIDHANGAWIARIDADDIALPDRFTKQMSFLQENPDIQLLGGRYQLIDEHGHLIRESDPIFTSDFLIRWRMLFFNSFVHSTVIFNRHAAIQCNGYNPQKLHTEDYGLWVQLMRNGLAANLPDVLIQLRRHTESISVIHENIQRQTTREIAWENFTHTLPELAVSPEQFDQFRKYYDYGPGVIHTSQEIFSINQWLKCYQTFCKKFRHNKIEQHVMDKWLQKRLFHFPSTLIKVPKIIQLFPIQSIAFLLITIINRLFNLPAFILNKFDQAQVIPKTIGMYVKVRNVINKRLGKPKIFLYTDSRGQKIENKYLKHQGIFPLYALPLLNHYQIEYHTCEETHTIFLDFLRVYEASKKDYDIVIAHIGIVDFSPRPASGVQAIYELKKEWFDKIFGVSNMESHILNPMETTYEGECTNNLYSLQMAEKHLIPALKAIPNLIWISSNHFVPGWRGNYFKERPSNIAITEDYAQRFAELLPNVINLLNWQIDDIKTYTCDNIHLSKAGFKQISIQLLSEIRKVLENKSSQ